MTSDVSCPPAVVMELLGFRGGVDRYQSDPTTHAGSQSMGQILTGKLYMQILHADFTCTTRGLARIRHKLHKLLSNGLIGSTRYSASSIPTSLSYSPTKFRTISPSLSTPRSRVSTPRQHSPSPAESLHSYRGIHYSFLSTR